MFVDRPRTAGAAYKVRTILQNQADPAAQIFIETSVWMFMWGDGDVHYPDDFKFINQHVRLFCMLVSFFLWQKSVSTHTMRLNCYCDFSGSQFSSNILKSASVFYSASFEFYVRRKNRDSPSVVIFLSTLSVKFSDISSTPVHLVWLWTFRVEFRETAEICCLSLCLLVDVSFLNLTEGIRKWQ